MPDIEKIYNEYFDDVYHYLRALTANEQLAEELTSDTFFKAMRGLNNFKGDCDIRVWLCQIAKNSYYTYCKVSKRQKDYDPKEAEEVLSENAKNIEQLLVNKEEAFILHQKLHELKEPYKEVFSLRVFGELSFKQIGLLFGKSEHWACVTYHRSRIKLRGGEVE